MFPDDIRPLLYVTGAVFVLLIAFVLWVNLTGRESWTEKKKLPPESL